jgi:uncharacterized CHY-type Zn-finger protein
VWANLRILSQLSRLISGSEQLLATIAVPSTRWTLCLLVLHVYSPAALQQVSDILEQRLGPALEESGLAVADGHSAALRFAGLRSLGPSKLVATVADEDAAKLRSVAAWLHCHLATWAEVKPPSSVPHVSILKITWILGNKKGKTMANAAAKTLAMHRADWSAVAAGFRAVEVEAVGWSLLEMHPGGGASMGVAPHTVAWQQQARPQLQPQPQSQPPQRAITDASAVTPFVGVGVDTFGQSRCAHWHSELDVLALRSPCCDKFYACASCHDELEDHALQPWPAGTALSTQALLCGVCETAFSAGEYLGGGGCCPRPSCAAPFNPGCKGHWPIYFSAGMLERAAAAAAADGDSGGGTSGGGRASAGGTR